VVSLCFQVLVMANDRLATRRIAGTVCLEDGMHSYGIYNMMETLLN